MLPYHGENRLDVTSNFSLGHGSIGLGSIEIPGSNVGPKVLRGHYLKNQAPILHDLLIVERFATCGNSIDQTLGPADAEARRFVASGC